MRIYFLVLFAVAILDYGFAKKASKRNAVPKANQTIEPWEYCEGCKLTVDLYSRLTSEKMAEMQAAHEDSSSAVDADSLVKGMCDNTEFSATYKPAAKYSCIKLLDENRSAFLNAWVGSSSAALAMSKGGVFEKKKDVSCLYIGT